MYTQYHMWMDNILTHIFRERKLKMFSNIFTGMTYLFGFCPPFLKTINFLFFFFFRSSYFAFSYRRFSLSEQDVSLYTLCYLHWFFFRYHNNDFCAYAFEKIEMISPDIYSHQLCHVASKPFRKYFLTSFIVNILLLCFLSFFVFFFISFFIFSQLPSPIFFVLSTLLFPCYFLPFLFIHCSFWLSSFFPLLIFSFF